MPKEQIIAYFQAASSERGVLLNPTRNVVAIVVASIATQVIPRLLESTASTMAKLKMLNSAQ